MSRTGLSEIRTMFVRITETAENMGMRSTERWALKEGSTTYGRVFGIVDVDPETGGQSDVFRYSTSRTETALMMRAQLDALWALGQDIL